MTFIQMACCLYTKKVVHVSVSCLTKMSIKYFTSHFAHRQWTVQVYLILLSTLYYAVREKFPVKDPFMELVKGSLNTFLNAMTYPDKTIYPVASCNDKDFQNLMDVYLDSVFSSEYL